MATTNTGPTLMSIPLELRHTIFEVAATRPDGPKKVLRRWFEKKEVKEVIAQHMADYPGGVAPRAVYSNDHYDEYSDMGEPGLGEGGSEEEEEGEDPQDEEEDDDDDEEPDDDDMDEVDEDQEAENDDGDMDEAQEAEEYEAMSEDGDGNAHGGVTATNGETQESENESEHEDETMDADDDEIVGGQHNPADGEAQEAEDEHGDETMNEDDGANADEEDAADGDGMAVNGDSSSRTATATQNVPPPPPPARIIRPHQKWRHIPKFLRISHCPPPRDLFLVCKQFSLEAKDWFYDVAVIRIDATGSFQHTSMFEESLRQIVDAAFSPFENIRKVEVKFVWDTEWMRAQGWVEGVFQALLRQRAMFVLEILKAAPELKDVVIYWHDSINDEDSTALKLDIAEGFLGLPANVKLEEYYLKRGEKPHRKSIAGKKRLEFQRILDEGLNLN